MLQSFWLDSAVTTTSRAAVTEPAAPVEALALPMNARVVVSTSLSAPEMPTPMFAPVVQPPAALTEVTLLLAWTFTSRPAATTAWSSIHADTSVLMSTTFTAPSMLSLSAFADACATVSSKLTPVAWTVTSR